MTLLRKLSYLFQNRFCSTRLPLSCCLILISIYGITFYLTQKPKIIECHKWQYLTDVAKQCLTEKFDNDSLAWDKNSTAAVLAECMPPITKLIRFENIPIHSDQKGLIPFARKYLANYPENSKIECLGLTFGIGNDINAELEVTRLLNQSCEWHGVDPMDWAGKVYRAIGKFYRVAVTATGGTAKGRILDVNKWYKETNLSSVSFAQFLQLSGLEGRVVDIFFMDNEGGEFGILEMLENTSSSESIANRLSTEFCQISIEYHMYHNIYPPKEVVYRRYAKFLVNSDYLPVWNYHLYDWIFSTFVINVKHPKCIEKYFSDYC